MGSTTMSARPDNDDKPDPATEGAPATAAAPEDATGVPVVPEEVGGPKGPEPTRFGDWERKGRCIDF